MTIEVSSSKENILFYAAEVDRPAIGSPGFLYFSLAEGTLAYWHAASGGYRPIYGYAPARKIGEVVAAGPGDVADLDCPLSFSAGCIQQSFPESKYLSVWLKVQLGPSYVSIITETHSIPTTNGSLPQREAMMLGSIIQRPLMVLDISGSKGASTLQETLLQASI